MILETSFLVDVLKGRPDAAALVEELDRTEASLYIPTPALFELWLGAGKTVKRREETEKIAALVDSYDLALFSDDDAREAGLLQARLSGSGRGMNTVDVMLAGMARARGDTLVTSDRDFSAVRRDVKIRSYERSG
jgi:predicted nucleic acid-binding protein